MRVYSTCKRDCVVYIQIHVYMGIYMCIGYTHMYIYICIIYIYADYKHMYIHYIHIH